MAYSPKPGGPKTLREMFHYLWGELKSIEANIGSGGGPGVSDHNDLTNVTPDQHHNQQHLLSGPDHTDVSDVTPTEGQLMGYESGLWRPIDAPDGATSHALLTDVQPDQHHSKVHFLVGKGPAGVHDHGDVQSDVFPQEGDILIFRGSVSTGEWKVEQLPSGGDGHNRGHRLTSNLDHTDVENKEEWELVDTDMLIWIASISQWITVPLANLLSHSLYGPIHSDVDTTNTLQQGSALTWDTTASKFKATVPTGYGSIRLDTETLMPALGAGWETVPFDAASLGTPVDVTQNFANDALVFGKVGVWSVSINIALEHNESNSGRVLGVRLYNATDANGGDTELRVYIGRNQSGSNVSVTFLSDVTSVGLNDDIQVQLSGLTDSFSAVNVVAANFCATYVGVS